MSILTPPGHSFNVGNIGHDPLDSRKQGTDVEKQRRQRQGSNSGTSDNGTRNRESAGKLRQGPQRRIEKVSAQQKRAGVLALPVRIESGKEKGTPITAAESRPGLSDSSTQQHWNGERLAGGPGGGNERPWSANGFAETCGQGRLRRVVRSIASWSFHRFASRAHGRHPFVPAGPSPVAHCTVHRPQCPIITGSGIAFR